MSGSSNYSHPGMKIRRDIKNNKLPVQQLFDSQNVALIHIRDFMDYLSKYHPEVNLDWN